MILHENYYELSIELWLSTRINFNLSCDTSTDQWHDSMTQTNIEFLGANFACSHNAPFQ